jgi:XTP/dITP diphosphohydrolase
VAKRVVLVVLSPRIPPGQLSWPAWQALRSGPVLTAAASPQLPFLQDAGVSVQLVTPTPDLLLDHDAPTVVWLTTGSEDADLVRELGLQAVRTGVTLEQVHGSYDPPGARLLDVVAVMDRLRSPGGCPWDAGQTHESLKPYLLEEAYEAYQALEDGDLRDLREELGDVLLQVAFHARLAQEADEPWSIDEVAGDLVDKLVRRHPHVFAGASADDLEGTWEALKQAEKGRRRSPTACRSSQPALSLAAHAAEAGQRGSVPPYRRSTASAAELWELVRRCREAGLDRWWRCGTTPGAPGRLDRRRRSPSRGGREPAALTRRQWSTVA